LTVLSSAPEIITESPLPGAVRDEPYSAVIETEGGTYPFSWAISAGTLPDGLLLQPPVDGSVEIAGTPTQSEHASFTLTLTDDSGRSASREFELVVCLIAPPPSTEPLLCPLDVN